VFEFIEENDDGSDYIMPEQTPQWIKSYAPRNNGRNFALKVFICGLVGMGLLAAASVLMH
jgi:hypothetical protein